MTEKSRPNPRHTEFSAASSLAPFRACPEPMVFTDTSHRLQWCNAAFEDLLGFRQGDLTGRPVCDLCPRPSVPGTGLTGAGERDTAKRLMSLRHRNGSLIQREATVWPLLDEGGELVGHVTHLRDMSDQRRLDLARAQLLEVMGDQTLTADNRITALLELGSDLFRMPVALVAQTQDEGLKATHSAVSPANPGDDLKCAFDCGPCRRTLAVGKTQERSGDSNAYLLAGRKMRSYAGAPLRRNGAAFGTLSFHSPSARRPFSPDEREILDRLANAVARELMLEQQIGALKEAATQDWLTGAGSNRQFRSDLAEAFRTVRRNGATASLILLDVDHFKSINDTYGHDMGDTALIEIARRIQEVIGPKRRLYRVGGEEFAVILPGSCADSATLFAERLRQKIAAPPHGELGLPTITASFGVAELDDDLDSEDGWLKSADIALYAAKNRGRNRVISNRGLAGVRSPLNRARDLPTPGEKITIGTAGN